MPRRVKKHPERSSWLVLVLGRAELEHGLFGNVKIIDDHVEVHLLRNLLPGPVGWRIVLDLLEGDALPVVGANVDPIGSGLDLPVEHGAVESRRRIGIGAVDHETWEACDSHTGHRTHDSGRFTSG